MSAAFAIRDAMNDIDEAPGKVWFWELERAVIDAGRCVQCGVCVAACPSDSLGIGPDDLPKLVKMCTGCSLCWDFCPRGGLRYETLGELAEEGEWTLTGGLNGHSNGHSNGHGSNGYSSNGHGTNGHALNAMPSLAAEAVLAASPSPTLALTPIPSPSALGEGSVAVERGSSSQPHSAAVHPSPSAEGEGVGGEGRLGEAAKARHSIRRDNLQRTRERYTARVAETIPGVQDGGVVSALLIELLEGGQIDGALVARPSTTEPWKGVAHLAQTREDVLACAGSFYNQTLALGHLDLKKYDLPPNPRIALVGTPCEIQGLRAMQARPFYWGASKVDAVVLTVALLCTKSFDYEGLMLREIQQERGISLQDLAKIDIIRGKLYLYDEAGATLLEEPIREFHRAALKGCDECADFLGVAADISVGSVGSADGYSSVLIWTEAGQTAFRQLAPRLEIRELDKPQSIEKLDALDKSVAFKNLKRPYDPDAPLFIDYADHLHHYDGTDRAPVDYEPVRW